jgi:Haemolysin secretion/activation protein ShlB/FhaC/HecB
MKKYFLIFLLFIYSTCLGQNFYLEIKSSNTAENRVIDSLNYTRKHSSEKKITEETNLFIEKIQKTGFLEAQIIDLKKPNDTTFSYLISLGEKINFVHIYIGEENRLILDEKSDTLKIDFPKSETYLNDISKKVESKGYSVSKVRLKNIATSHKTIKADLDIELDTKRTLNEIVITGYDKFPIGFKKKLEKNLKNKTFNRESLEKISSYFKSISFVRQTKYPEILFNSDTTKVYVYLEKKKNNYFDGFLGFSNPDKKLVLNGYLDLNLNNTLNTGDIFSIKWRSDGNDQKNFNLGIELPFVFKSPIGLKLQLNIFKQDSTFQNSKTDIDLSYSINNKTKAYLGYQNTESSDIGNSNSNLLSDFKNHFFTTSFTYINPREDFLFPEKANLSIKIGLGERTSKTQTNSQFIGSLNLNYIFELNKKNSLSISSHNYLLVSDNYLVNELFRFGGIKSIRGFKENSLQANQANLILSEYRYRFSPNFFIHTIVDYGYFKDITTNSSNKPLGIGFGFGLLNKSGLFNFVYANGIDNKQIVKLSNSIIHISFKTYF